MVHCIVRGQEHCIEVGHLGRQSEVLYSQLPVLASDSGKVIALFNALSITRYKSFSPETTWQCFSQVLSVKAMLLWVIKASLQPIIISPRCHWRYQFWKIKQRNKEANL